MYEQVYRYNIKVANVKLYEDKTALISVNML